MKVPGSFLVVAAVVLASLHMHAQAYPEQRYWKYSSPRVEIGPTDQPPGRQPPPCGNGADNIKAADVVTRAGASTIDSYLRTMGTPSVYASGMTSALLGAVSDASNRQWLQTRLGVGSVHSTCATECVIVPKERAPSLSVWGCLSEPRGNGLACGESGWMAGRLEGAFNLTHQDSPRAVTYCMTGKNWSDRQSRWFWVVASDLNPTSGRPR